MWRVGVLAAFSWLMLDFISRMLFRSNIHGFPEAISIASHSSDSSQPSGLECPYKRGEESLQHPRHLFEEFWLVVVDGI